MKAIDRVIQLIEKQKLTNSAFERKVGLSNGYIAKQFTRNADLGESIFIKILENCPEVNPTWLLTGKGEMIKGYNEQELSLVKEDDVLYNALNESLNDKKRIIELLEAENFRLKQLLHDNNK